MTNVKEGAGAHGSSRVHGVGKVRGMSHAIGALILYAGMEIEEVPDAKDLAFLSSGVARLGHTGAHALQTRGCTPPGMHLNYQH